MIVLVLVLNAVRFLGFGTSPPGFYVDEAAGAAQVLCISQTGADFFGRTLPLFSSGLGGGFYTAPFLYGELLWTSVFGHSIFAFRSFLGLVTGLTVLFLYLWARRRAGERVALFTALSASVMPWAFQFSRIAWDPPLAALFIAMALWASGVGRGIFAGLFLAFAAYSYPPMRVGAVLLWVMLPGRTWRETLRDLGVFVVVCIPLFVRSMDGDFTARGRMLALWSTYSSNPYAEADIFGMFGGFVKQVLEHFTPAFLFGSGDANLRHSIQTVGMLSWLDALAVLGGLIALLRRLMGKARVGWSVSEKEVLAVSLIGVMIGVMPAALTWEGVPHSLRAIGAWPFFALFTGVILAKMEEWWRAPGAFKAGTVGALSHLPALGFSVIAIAFFTFYLSHYFGDYAESAAPWFQNENAPLAQAYPKMVNEGKSCAELRK